MAARGLSYIAIKGIIGLFIDAKDEAAKAYYERYGFVNLEDTPLELFLPLATIKQFLQPR